MKNTTERTVAIVQARMGSARLPGKVLRNLGNVPILGWVLERLQQATELDEIVVATTQEIRDDPIESFANRLGVPVFRGDEHDVLSRYLGAAAEHHADLIVRVTADCPFIDPELVDQVVTQIQREVSLDYACNFFPHRHFPRGLDVECVRLRALERVQSSSPTVSQQEHVTLGIYQNPDRFQMTSVSWPQDYSEHRWTIDTPEDLQLAEQIARNLANRQARWQTILQLVENNREWTALNAGIVQKVA